MSLEGQNVFYFVGNLPALALEEDIIFILLDGKPAYHLLQKEILLYLPSLFTLQILLKRVQEERQYVHSEYM